MESSLVPLLCGVGILLSIIPGSILFYWINKKGWLTLRLLALLAVLMFSTLAVIFWIYEANKILLFGTLGLGILAGLTMLTLNITSPRLVKLLNLKW
jgi:hypothetical protein